MTGTEMALYGGLGLTALGTGGGLMRWLLGRISKVESTHVSLEKFNGQVRLCGSEIQDLRDESKEQCKKIDDLKDTVANNKVEFLEKMNEGEKNIMTAINKIGSKISLL
jgi:hypothetical protein